MVSNSKIVVKCSLFIMLCLGSIGMESVISEPCSDSFTILGIWVLGLADTHINGSNCKLMSPEHYFS